VDHIYARQRTDVNIGTGICDHLIGPMQCPQILLLREFARSIREGRRSRFGALKISDAHVATDLKLPTI
jgi:hypothetical protein